jgi:cytochrome c oxidase assembly factor CtaG
VKGSTSARAACVPVGLVAFAVGASLDDPPTLHMVGHMVVANVAAPLVAAGLPIAFALRRLGPARARRLGRLQSLLSPAVAWVAFALAQWAVAVGPLPRLAERHLVLHVGEHVTLLAAAILFYSHVLHVLPGPRRLPGIGPALYALSAMPPADAVALWLVGTGRTGPGVAMAAGSLPLGAVALIATWSALLAEERRQEKREAYGAA